jgi:1-acyl-sn-glycerol-3-phosphate acyltransferase
MQNIVIDKPYVPIPPYHGKIWPWLLVRYSPRLVRSCGITRTQCVHVERLRASIDAGHGILLTPNHSRDEDPLVLGALSRAVRSPFFIIASWHLFMQSKIKTFLLRRAGAFSIYREGVDRAAVNTAIEIIENAERPLVIFPEGFVSRTNDRINALLEGTGLIARSAAKKRAKMEPPRKVVVHPIALRYRFHGDIERAAAKVLEQIETRLTWRPRHGAPLYDRIVKVGAALLCLKEIEYLGAPQSGEIGERLARLIDAVLNPLEDEWADGAHDGTVNARVKRLRTAILPDMIKGDIDEAERQRRWKQLADVYVANQLYHYPADYVKSNPTPERILETIEKFEEDLTDKVSVHGEISATITVGEAIEVNPARESRGGPDPLLQQIESQWRQMLGIAPTSPAAAEAAVSGEALQ